MKSYFETRYMFLEQLVNLKFKMIYAQEIGYLSSPDVIYFMGRLVSYHYRH